MLLIRLYQRAISPLSAPTCRFEPSCSRYAYEAVERHGAIRGTWMGIRRIGRCRPGAAGGYDPVPGSPAAAALRETAASELADQDVTADTAGRTAS